MQRESVEAWLYHILHFAYRNSELTLYWGSARFPQNGVSLRRSFRVLGEHVHHKRWRRPDMHENEQPNNASVRRAVFGILVAIAFAAICITPEILRTRDCPTAQSIGRNAETPSGTPVRPTQCPTNTLVTNTKPSAGQDLDPTAPSQPRRLIAYGVLSDGTTVSIYEPVEPRGPARPTESGELGSSHNQGTSRDTTYSREHRLQSTVASPRVAENGSYYGQTSENTARPKTVYVGGYHRKDGTYVRSHYRSAPHR